MYHNKIHPFFVRFTHEKGKEMMTKFRLSRKHIFKKVTSAHFLTQAGHQKSNRFVAGIGLPEERQEQAVAK